MITDDKIQTLARHFNTCARLAIGEGNGLPSTIFLVARENPITGEPANPDAPVIPLVQPNTMSKERFAQAARAVAVAAKARAAIIILDAWFIDLRGVARSKYATKEEAAAAIPELLGHKAVSEHDDRQSAISTTIEYDDGPVNVSYSIYRKDDGRIVFDEPFELNATLQERIGTWCILNDPGHGDPPDVVMHSCRNVAAFLLQGVDWLPSVFEPLPETANG